MLVCCGTTSTATSTLRHLSPVFLPRGIVHLARDRCIIGFPMFVGRCS